MYNTSKKLKQREFLMHSKNLYEHSSGNATFINLKLNPDIANPLAYFEAFCSAYADLIKSNKNRFPDANFNCTFGMSRHMWETLYPNITAPKHLVTFQEIKGAKYTAVSTHGDLFLYIRASRSDICFEVAQQVLLFTKAFTLPEYEVHGFSYLDGRAIIGFVDGTANPVEDDAYKAVIIGEEDAFFAGGSYVFTQKYLHDMSAWNTLPTEQQEKIIGRKKYNDIELEDDQKAVNAHNVISLAHHEDGSEIEILRANVVFANPSLNEFGTYFIGFTNNFEHINTMLKNMFIGKPEGNYDGLLDFSTAITGTLFFLPSFDLIDKMANGL